VRFACKVSHRAIWGTGGHAVSVFHFISFSLWTAALLLLPVLSDQEGAASQGKVNLFSNLPFPIFAGKRLGLSVGAILTTDRRSGWVRDLYSSAVKSSGELLFVRFGWRNFLKEAQPNPRPMVRFSTDDYRTIISGAEAILQFADDAVGVLLFPVGTGPFLGSSAWLRRCGRPIVRCFGKTRSGPLTSLP